MKDNVKAKGASLPTVIMVVALMMTLAFTVVAIAFTHLNLSFRSNNNAKAKHLAEAVLAQAIEKAFKNQESYGVTTTPEDSTIQLSFDSYPTGNLGVLSFDKDTAASLGVPYSTNNRSESSVAGSNPAQAVPGQSLHLVARAEVGGAFSTMEAIIEIPKFPYSVASNGAIRSKGGLLVASLRAGSAYDLSLPIHEDDLEPGHLVSNSKIGNDAVVMEGENKIVGDLQSASGATIEEDTQVLGEIRLDADPVTLDKLNAYDYQPDASDNPQTVNSGAATLEVEGYNVSENDLTIDNGIELNGGVLFVEGKLTVSAGGVSGRGAIIATDGIEINGGGETTSDNQAALISDGNITLKGTAADKAKFAGLIYTKGNLSSENMRLAGVFVAAGDNSEVTLKDTELYQVEDYATLEVKASGGEFEPDPAVPKYTYTDVANNIIEHQFQASYDMAGIKANLDNYLNPNYTVGSGEPRYLFKAQSGSTYLTWTFNPATGAKVSKITTGPDQYVLDGGAMGLKLWGVEVHSVTEAENVAVAHFQALYAAQTPPKTMTTAQIATIKDSAKGLYENPNPAKDIAFSSVDYTMANPSPGGGGADPNGSVLWSIDLSEILGDYDPMRVVYWAEYR